MIGLNMEMLSKCSPAKNRSQRAVGRPIRRIKRKQEKARRYILKNGIGARYIQFLKEQGKQITYMRFDGEIKPWYFEEELNEHNRN